MQRNPPSFRACPLTSRVTQICSSSRFKLVLSAVLAKFGSKTKKQSQSKTRPVHTPFVFTYLLQSGQLLAPLLKGKQNEERRCSSVGPLACGNNSDSRLITRLRRSRRTNCTLPPYHISLLAVVSNQRPWKTSPSPDPLCDRSLFSFLYDFSFPVVWGQPSLVLPRSLILQLTDEQLSCQTNAFPQFGQ